MELKRQILFLHSAGAQGPHQGSSDLVTSLQQSLGEQYEVLYPKMPNPERPSYEPWKEKLERELADLEGELILIGHSLGGSVLLKHISENAYRQSVAGLFLVATPYWGIDEEWSVEQFQLHEDFPSKLGRIPRIHIYHSRDDEFVPFEHAGLYAAKLPRAIMRALDRRGHVFGSGIPELVDDIRSMRIRGESV
ncbi:MAG: serine hydrolase family protein [Paenibacillus sp.]|jgi:predicted alpha/beta hydrolase family esterase|nr:serine hydrolase family protein [Paenibacillus sp.]